MTMRDRTYATAVTGILLASAALAQDNVLFVTLDDVGVDGIAAYKEGGSPAPTPTLSALATRGVLFRNAYACPTCTPTRATLHTGRFPFRTGVGGLGVSLPLSETALPEILPSTYAHALIGKWHLGNQSNYPNQTGWSHFSGVLGGGVRSYTNWTKTTNGRQTNSTVYATTAFVDDALTWIRAQTKPWVLSLNFNAPHSPLHEPPSQLHTYDLTGKNTRRDAEFFYKAMLQAADTELGRLLSSLGTATLQKTNIIVLGDNGTPRNILEPPFMAPGKGSVYEAGVNVPLIVAGPIVSSPGREVASFVHSVDMFHTIAELAGVNARNAVPANVELDGISIVPYLKNANQRSLRQFGFAEKFGSTTTDDRALRDARYKIILLDQATEELYDLQNDPFEQANLLTRTLTATEHYHYNLLQADLARLSDVASWFAFGVGCRGKAGVPALTNVLADTPRLGQAFSASVTNLGDSLAVIGFLGFSNETYGALRLPFDLAPIGMPSCELLVAADTTSILTNASGTARWDLAIPNVASLLGIRFYQQAFVLDASANTLGAIVSNAGYAVIERN